MAFTPAHTSTLLHIIVLITPNDAHLMDLNPELNPIAHAMAQAQEQLWVVMEVQHLETQLQNWAEKTVTTKLEESGNIVVLDKKSAVEAAKEMVEEIGKRYHQVSLGFI